MVALEVGAFHPAWGDIHLGPENALKACELLGGARFLPVHWGTFNLAMHDWDEPAEVLLKAGAGVPLLMPQLGRSGRAEPHRARPTPWWRTPGKLLDSATPRPWRTPTQPLDPNAPLAWPLD